MTWSEIFAEFEIKHQYLYKQLELRRSLLTEKGVTAEQSVESLKQNSAIQPSQIVIPG